MPEELKTFCQELVWFDDTERGDYFAVVLAPNQEIAERMIAAEMLDAGNDSLFELYGHDDELPSTLKHYYDSHGELGAWGDIGGTACPNCTSHTGQPAGDEVEIDGCVRRQHICSACGYSWIPLGFDDATRTQLEDGARQTIAALDEIERESASDGEDDPDYDDQGNLKVGVDNA